jgi:hypothetical protein
MGLSQQAGLDRAGHPQQILPMLVHGFLHQKKRGTRSALAPWMPQVLQIPVAYATRAPSILVGVMLTRSLGWIT